MMVSSPPPPPPPPSSPSQPAQVSVRRLDSSVDGSGQSIGITNNGKAYTWGRTNNLGQLGRRSGDKPSKEPHPATFVDESSQTTTRNVHVIRAFAGGNSEAGHTAVIDNTGALWLTGSDRWQQLGLCSSSLGANGYTWNGLWKEAFHRNAYVSSLLRDMTGNSVIRDVALGGDHTLVLSANKKDVIAFGKGGEGQLGLTGKPWVSAPVKSKHLSSRRGVEEIAAVCAINHCSLALGDDGKIIRKAGRCSKSQSEDFAAALQHCQDRAQRDGLVSQSESAAGR